VIGQPDTWAWGGSAQADLRIASHISIKIIMRVLYRARSLPVRPTTVDPNVSNFTVLEPRTPRSTFCATHASSPAFKSVSSEERNQTHPRRLTKGRASVQPSCLADDDSPGPDDPRGDQAIANVRIAVSEALNNGAIVCPPNEYRSIRGFGKGTCEDQVPTAMGFPSQR
jgi:hypothetical protein